MKKQRTQIPYQTYVSLDLGRGGYARYSSDKARAGIKAVLKKKYKNKKLVESP